jgi:hypothetical protein
VRYPEQLALREAPLQDDLRNQAEECVEAQCVGSLAEMGAVCLLKAEVHS